MDGLGEEREIDRAVGPVGDGVTTGLNAGDCAADDDKVNEEGTEAEITAATVALADDDDNEDEVVTSWGGGSVKGDDDAGESEDADEDDDDDDIKIEKACGSANGLTANA